VTLSVTDWRNRFSQPGLAELELIRHYAELADHPHRLRAFEAFASTGLPHRRMEAWGWSDVKAALQTLQAPSAASETEPLTSSTQDEKITIAVSETGFELPKILPDGLSLHLRTEPQALAQAEDLPLAALTAALSGASKSGEDKLIIEASGDVRTPLHIVVQAARVPLSLNRLVILVRPQARLDLIETYLGGAGLSSVLIEAGVQQGGRLNRTILQRGTCDEVQIVTALVHAQADARYCQTQLAFGARLTRLETHLVHQASGSQAILNGAYLCGAGAHVDMTSHVRHGAPACQTTQMTKGAVLKGGTGVFQGKFHVPRTIGQYTNANMQHQALLLEEGATVFAKPELEIYADDVECAHGNTSGALDETQLFYMRQRGLPVSQARALLTEAFIAEALSEAHPDIQASLQAAARDFLTGGG